MKTILNTLYDLNEQVINGEREALPVYIEIKRVEKLVAEILKGLQEQAIDEAGTYGKGEHELNGAKFQVKNAAGRWDFKSCTDWVGKKTELEQLEESYKALYKARYFGEFARVEDGEVMQLPKYTDGKTTIAIKL